MAVVGELKSLKDLEDLKSFRGLVVLHFWAPWSEPCKQMQEAMEELAKENPNNVKFFKVVAEDVPDVTTKFKVIAVPTFILLKGGEVVDRVNGAHVPELTKKTASHSKYVAGLPATLAQPSPEKDIDAKLKKLINSAPCMLFMKGTPKDPRCGFSRKTVEILQEQGTEFSTFNIFMDDAVREGLKKYSNWPTYPQLYVNGELIGGLDIVKEMQESGELESILPKSDKSQSLEDRLKAIIHRHRVMLFMKGTPTQPRCGFSKTVCGILHDTKVDFETFDILQDDEVRQGLKKYSNWPTYPQLYVQGELIGGLDIVKELQQSEELNETLNPLK